MTKKYTPGPWEIAESRNDSYGDVKDCPIWIKGDDWVLASIVDDVEYIDGEANARLIVCAPELLEMLEEITEYGIGVDVIRKAKRLIAKAIGE